MGASLPVSPSSINFTGAFFCLMQGVQLTYGTLAREQALPLGDIVIVALKSHAGGDARTRLSPTSRPPPPPPSLFLPRFNFAARFTFSYLTKIKFRLVSSSMNDMHSVLKHVDNTVHCNLNSILLLDIKVT